MPERASSSARLQSEENGYTLSRLADDEVVWLSFKNTGRAAIDGAAAALKRLLKAWHPDRTLRLLIDLRHEDAVISLYALRRFREVVRFRPAVQTRIALLTEDRLSLEIAALARRGMCLGPHCHHASATDEQRALDWLLVETPVTLLSA